MVIYIYMEIRKGMYRLPQADKLANKKLKLLLQANNHYPTEHTPECWTYTHKDIYFSLVVDDFGVKYTNKSDVHKLMKFL